MKHRQVVNSILRTLVWLGAFVSWAYMVKPEGSSFLGERPGLMALSVLGLLAAPNLVQQHAGA